MPQSLAMPFFAPPDFGREPRLGVYNTVALDMLRGRPYDANWAHVFGSLDVETLFDLSLRSREMWSLVLEYVKDNGPNYWHADEYIRGGRLDHISKLPAELFDLIFDGLATGDKIRLAGVSKKFRALCARHAQVAVARLLRNFGLTHAGVRFMQTATRAIIAGPGIAAFMDNAFPSRHIDFYVPDRTYSRVVRFFDVATGYDSWPEDVVHDHPNVRERTTFIRPHFGSLINVNQSRTDSAMDCVPYFSFTHLMVSLTDRGAWFGYPASTAAGVSLPNRASINLANERTKYELHELIRETVGSYRIAFNLDHENVCGSAFECPSTPRFTTDGGCFQLFFPALPLGCQASTSVYPVDSVMSWSLGRRVCAVQLAQRTSHRWRDDGYAQWKDATCKVIRQMCWARLQRDLTEHFFGDRSTPRGALWTFKRCGEALEFDSDTRDRLGLLFVHVFGQVDMVAEAVGRTGCVAKYLLISVKKNCYIVRLRCPPGAHCRVLAAYRKQVDLLQSAMADASSTATGPRRSCWFAPATDDAIYPPVDGCFYVRLPRTPHARRPLTPLPSVPHVHAIHRVVQAVWRQGPSVSQVRGGLSPNTRCVSVERAKWLDFHLKDLAVEAPPTAETRGYLLVFQCLAFGELVSLVFSDDRGSVAIQLQCPSNASCAVVELYSEQIRTLEDGTTCVNSFFSSLSSGLSARRDGDKFWVYVNAHYPGYRDFVEEKCTVGKTVDVVVTFRRVDALNGSTGAFETVCRFGSLGQITIRAWFFAMTTLTGMRVQNSPGLYEVEFSANQVAYSADGVSSSYIYKPMSHSPTTHRRVYSHSERQIPLPSHEFRLVGTVIGLRASAQRDGEAYIYYVALGLPDSPTPAAVELYSKQSAELRYVASVDQTNAERSSKVKWGPTSPHIDTTAPTAAIMIYLSHGLRKVKKGNDVAITCKMLRFDDCVDGVLVMSGTKKPLRPWGNETGNPVRRAAFTGVSGVNGSAPIPLFRCFSYSHWLHMLARMNSYGVLALSGARYGEDFDAVRKCTLDGGCLYLFKKMPEIMNLGTREYKGSLQNYTGYIFGEVDKLFPLTGEPEVLVRLKLPADASCAAVHLWAKQEASLKYIMARDDALFGGSVKDSFFNQSATYPAIAFVPNSFYVAFETSPHLTNTLKRNPVVVMKVSISRHDQVNAVTNETERSYRVDMWNTEIHPTSYVPSRRGDGYVCDVNGPVGMLAHMRSYGVLAVANAQYREDFDAVRKHTLDEGSLFFFKKIPQAPVHAAREYKDALRNYVGYIFGGVDKLFTLPGASEAILRIKLPAGASCDSVRLWAKQEAVLRHVMERDDALVIQGGSVKDSFFDCSSAYPTISFVPDCLTFKEGTAVLLEVFISRHDKENLRTGDIERFYRLDMWSAENFSASYIPSRRRDDYVCDINGTVGLVIISIRAASNQRVVARIRRVNDQPFAAPERMNTTTVPLTTSRRISEIDATLEASEFQAYVSAYLFATGVRHPVRGRVPVISANMPREVSNMKFMVWMATDPVHPVTNLSWIEMDAGDGLAFIVFTADQDSPMGRADLLHPVNDALSALHPSALPPFRGNVLVMRRERGASVLLDVRHSDLDIATHCAIGPLRSATMSGIDLGSLRYQQDFDVCTESRQDRENATHSIHTHYLLTGGTPFEALIVGTLMGAVRLNDDDTLLVLGSPSDCVHFPDRVENAEQTMVLSDAAWTQKNRIMVTVSALTEKVETALGSSRSAKFRGSAIAGELIKCKVVLQREDRCRGAETQCVEVFDRSSFMASLIETLQRPGTHGFINAVYHKDYDAIRIRSTVGGLNKGSVFVFVDSQLPVYGLAERKRRRHNTRMHFLVGEVDYISPITVCAFGDELRELVCVRLRAPTSATCEVRRLYAEQLDRLQDILNDDDETLSSTSTATWFDAGAVSAAWKRKPGCFYVFMRASRGSRTERLLAVREGDSLTISVAMERVDVDMPEGIMRRGWRGGDAEERSR
ncbi:hypothetical protein DFH06DRAFT_1154579, partial [Mycena polygramma]